MKKRGVFLVNLGTPLAPRRWPVAAYLREFLMDPLVIDIPAFWRALLVYAYILPTRPQKSAEAYRKIWTERGSPLLFHSRDLVRGVQAELGEKYQVILGMRYGAPSLEQGLIEFKRLENSGQLESLLIAPLYPQYSLAASESSYLECERVRRELKIEAPVEYLKPFYTDAAFVSAFASRGRETLAGAPCDHVLFSFHGIPERQIKKTDPTEKYCLASDDCCAQMNELNKNCYRAQSYATAHAIARELSLTPEKYSVSFQSRLGRTPWIRPYTDVVLRELAQKGVRDLVVYCPAFVADCLETLEEIEIRGAADFKSFGGRSLRLVPSLNATPEWAAAVASWSRS